MNCLKLRKKNGDVEEVEKEDIEEKQDEVDEVKEKDEVDEEKEKEKEGDTNGEEDEVLEEGEHNAEKDERDVPEVEDNIEQNAEKNVQECIEENEKNFEVEEVEESLKDPASQVDFQTPKKQIIEFEETSPISPYLLQVIQDIENTYLHSDNDNKNTIDHDIPNFDLGISQEFPTFVVQKQHTKEKGDAIDPMPLAISIENPHKRQTKASAYLCSPYKKREVAIGEEYSTIEIKVTDRVFALFGDTK